MEWKYKISWQFNQSLVKIVKYFHGFVKYVIKINTAYNLPLCFTKNMQIWFKEKTLDFLQKDE